MTDPTVAIGIDTSMTNTGVAVLDAESLTLKSIKSSGSRSDNIADRRDRLHKIRGKIMSVVLDAPGGSVIAIEGPSFGSKGGSAHDRSGLWWLVVDELRELRHKVVIITPSQRAKFATGTGNASKAAVIDAAARRWPEVETGGDDNLIDAMVLALMVGHHYGIRTQDLPKAHLAALDKVDWH